MFRLDQNDTTPGREIIAGLTTFAAMAYILAVNPSMLAITGMDQSALITATALSASFGTILMALMTNLPIALAPGMGLNAFFTFTVCGQMQVPWQGALAMVFWNGVLFLALSLTGFRNQVVRAIPESLKIGIQAGIGLFILVIGLKNLGLFGDPAPGFIALRFEEIGKEFLVHGLLAGAGLIAVLLLMRFRVPGAILLAILIVAVIGLFVTVDGNPVTRAPDRIVAVPASPAPIALQLDWLYPFRHWEIAWVAVLTLVFVDLFDSVGTLIGVSRLAGFVKRGEEFDRMKPALTADAAGTTVGACLGVSPVTAYIESATGVEAGGRTGLTSIVVAACFLVALFFHPLIMALPAAAVAPALILVGILMMKGLAQLEWKDWRNVIPALATVALIPLNFQIAEGIACGCVLYTVVMACSGKWREIHWFLAVLSVLFVIKFVGDFTR